MGLQKVPLHTLNVVSLPTLCVFRAKQNFQLEPGVLLKYSTHFGLMVRLSWYWTILNDELVAMLRSLFVKKE